MINRCIIVVGKKKKKARLLGRYKGPSAVAGGTQQSRGRRKDADDRIVFNRSVGCALGDAHDCDSFGNGTLFEYPVSVPI